MKNEDFLTFKNHQGATLIELLVVCTLLMLVATLTIGASRLYQRFATHMELEHLYMACRYMQRRAMCMHQEQQLVINVSTRSYRYAHHNHTLTSGVYFGAPPNVKGPPAQPTHAIINPITFVSNTITFYPTGIISAGTAYFTNDAHSYCYALSNAVGTVSFLRRYVYRKTWQLIE